MDRVHRGPDGGEETMTLTADERASVSPAVKFRAADGITSIRFRSDEEMVAAVESILLARETALRETIALEIESAIENPTDPNVDAYHFDGLDEAARIVRGQA